MLLASMDLYAPDTPQNLTLIYRSDDDGKTWHYVSELMPCFWGKLFVHKGELYMLSVSTEFGDLQIGKSTDGGKTFSAPIVILRGSNGKKRNRGIHKNPQNVMYFGGRIYHTLEWSSKLHDAMVMSCDVNDDLLVPENWSFSEPKRLGFEAPELENYHDQCYAVEGTLVVDPQGKLLEIMRFNNFDGYALVYEVDTENHEAPLKYSRLMKFPGNLVKFMIKYDEVSKKYYSIICRIHDEVVIDTRNLLSLVCSENLENWELVCDLHDYRHCDHEKIGFQYVDFYFEGDDIIYLCRTGMNGANSHHNTNYATFHRIENFREL